MLMYVIFRMIFQIPGEISASNTTVLHLCIALTNMARFILHKFGLVHSIRQKIKMFSIIPLSQGYDK